jgi:hypothetical protein
MIQIRVCVCVVCVCPLRANNNSPGNNYYQYCYSRNDYKMTAVIVIVLEPHKNKPKRDCTYIFLRIHTCFKFPEYNSHVSPEFFPGSHDHRSEYNQRHHHQQRIPISALERAASGRRVRNSRGVIICIQLMS